MQNDCNKCTFMAIIQTLTCTRQRPIPANQNTIFTNTDLNKKKTVISSDKHSKAKQTKRT